MTVSAIVSSAPPGAHGFDCNTPLSLIQAREFRNKGFLFCVRYVARGSEGKGDLSTAETNSILNAGLALMAVQHVAPEGWIPNLKLGTTNGTNAAKNASQAGLISGVNLWLDLEGVKHSVPSEDVVDYCNAWFEEVEKTGFIGGVYVGANSILSGDELFWRLRTKHYWKSGSVVPDIPHRGYQMTQRIAIGDKVAGIEIDRNVTRTDGFGDSVQWMTAPAPATPIA